MKIFSIISFLLISSQALAGGSSVGGVDGANTKIFNFSSSQAAMNPNTGSLVYDTAAAGISYKSLNSDAYSVVVKDPTSIEIKSAIVSLTDKAPLGAIDYSATITNQPSVEFIVDAQVVETLSDAELRTSLIKMGVASSLIGELNGVGYDTAAQMVSTPDIINYEKFKIDELLTGF